MKKLSELLEELGVPEVNYTYPYQLFDRFAYENGVYFYKTFNNQNETKRELFNILADSIPQGYLPCLLGKDKNEGGIHFFDLLKMHTLVAGQTRSGKTTWLTTLIISLIHFSHPEYLKIVILDPKAAAFKKLDYVATLAQKNDHIIEIIGTINEELTSRIEYTANQANPGDAKECNKAAYHAREKEQIMPYIAVFFDEFADFIAYAKRIKNEEVEGQIQRLASLGLGLGINLTFTTQAPYKEYIKGIIKNNFERRITFSLGDYYQEQLILGKAPAGNELDAPRLQTGELVMREKGTRVAYNALLSTPECLATAAANWKRQGLNFKL